MSVKIKVRGKRGDLLLVKRVHSSTMLGGPTVEREVWQVVEATRVSRQGLVMAARSIETHSPVEVPTLRYMLPGINPKRVANELLGRDGGSEFADLDEARRFLVQFRSEAA